MAKEISEVNLVDGLKYSKEHEWATTGGDTIKIGITDYAQGQLGDVVFVEVRSVGAQLERGGEAVFVGAGEVIRRFLAAFGLILLYMLAGLQEEDAK